MKRIKDKPSLDGGDQSEILHQEHRSQDVALMRPALNYISATLPSR